MQGIVTDGESTFEEVVCMEESLPPPPCVFWRINFIDAQHLKRYLP